MKILKELIFWIIFLIYCFFVGCIFTLSYPQDYAKFLYKFLKEEIVQYIHME